MKKQTLFFLSLMFYVFLLNAQTTAIPDANFENYLETHDANGTEVPLGDATSMGDGVANNSLVLTASITDVLVLNVNNQNISNLTGIESFTSLENLICDSNSISSLDVSNLVNLKALLCGLNELSDLDIRSNSALEVLDCSSNRISDLILQEGNVARNPLLERLNCSNNRISNIDVSQNINLTDLTVSNNQISGELLVSNNTNLESLFCASNKINVLDLESNTVLNTLNASNNAFVTLDLTNINTGICPDPQTDPVTACQSSGFIDVSRNKLNSLNIANGFNDLIYSFNAQDNPDLFCIQTDSGFTAPNTWLKDDWAYFGDIGCTDIYTYVPDANFEEELITLGYDDVMDHLVLTSNIDTLTALNISNSNISSLIGIEDFAALQTLNCSLNTIEDLDVSNNTDLTNLNASNNSIASLNIENNPALTIMDVSNNSLASLDVSNNTALNNLNCSNNSIKLLDVSSLTALTGLNCESNALEVLNLKNGQNGNLLEFSALLNPGLSCIETDTGIVPMGVNWTIEGTSSYAVNCGTYVPDNGFEQAIIDAGFDTAPLDNYVPTANIVGETNLNASGYNILDLTGIEDFAALAVFDCSNNNIVELNLTANPALTTVNCNDNVLELLDLRNGANNPQLVTLNAKNNPSLYCINVDDLTYASNAGGWEKDDIASYSVDCENNRYSPILDDNFEQALIDLGLDTGPLDDQVLTSNIEYLSTLDVSGKNIQSLEGIKAFKSLLELDCSNNFLNTLDVSNMTSLKALYCSSNFFLTNNSANTVGLLNTDGTKNLKTLFCSGNALQDINVTTLLDLESLDCSDNKIQNLNVSNNVLLENLNCSNNKLLDLDISTLSDLVILNCSVNDLNDITTTGINNLTLTNLNCSNNNISALQIDNYLALEDLNSSKNNLSSITTSSNTALKTLSLTNNSIENLNLDANVNLMTLFASQNSLSNLDLDNNSILEYLEVNYNTIASIDLGTLASVRYLYINNNELSSIDISNNLNITVVDVSFNTISSLVLPNDLSQLKTFNCSNNVLEKDLDLSSLGTGTCPSGDDFCPDSITINVSNNTLDFVNIQNGMNADITSFNASSNPNLYCIQVDDANTIGANWFKDATSEYSEDCRFGETYVPDDNFEQALINLGYDAGILDDYVLTSTIETLTDLDISGNNISDLTGIQDFIALQNLNCSNNNIDTIDLSNNTALLELNCSNNLLNNLDVSMTPNLLNLDISNNNFTEFEPQQILSLQIFNCDSNQIVNLDFTSNVVLADLSCASNLLEILNIQNGQNPSLLNLNAQNNSELTCIQTDTGGVPGGVAWVKDASTEYAIECHYGETYVPDDGFESALINLGYDDILDDYVLTSNINTISFLNIGENEISDLTGIEGFTGLKTLLFDENMVENVDLSANIFLERLDASNNDITTIDLSVLSNLRILNIAGNNLSQVDVNSNLDLTELYVDNNALIILDISLLTNLEKLDCSSNMLQELDVTQNPNLKMLFCKSNGFIDDKLNLQNGANSTLKDFNAINNPDLGCILVDDPVAVISNTSGLYNDWFKDVTANYQLVCDDADNDGIANEDDVCPGTAFGLPVDLFGCPVLNLPNNNFTILITGETCLNNNNGKINITTLQYYNYTATLIGDDFNKDYHFTNDIDILNLLAGTYQMCITIEEWPNYMSCYDVVISQPEPLMVSTGKSDDGKKVSIEMSGSTSYNIDFNGLAFTTSDSNITLNLQQGINTIKIGTDADCQGIHQEKILLSDKTFVYPNPFQDKINMYLGVNDTEEVIVNMYSYLGQLVYSKIVSDQKTNELSIDTSKLALGMYTISVQTNASLSTFKIVKK